MPTRREAVPCLCCYCSDSRGVTVLMQSWFRLHRIGEQSVDNFIARRSRISPGVRLILTRVVGGFQNFHSSDLVRDPTPAVCFHSENPSGIALTFPRRYRRGARSTDALMSLWVRWRSKQRSIHLYPILPAFDDPLHS